MGSKSNPSKFDCYVKLEPDEPYFVLMGRDPSASILVMLWAAVRAELDEDEEKSEEAYTCSAEMATWCDKQGKVFTKALDRALITALARAQHAFLHGTKGR